MTQLSDVDIITALSDKRIVIEPLDLYNLQPASLDLTLGDSWLVPLAKAVDQEVVILVDRDAPYRAVTSKKRYLQPGEFILGTTAEKITLDTTVAAKFEGKSSLGRMGAMTHVTAGFIDPGFSGQITLEIVNVSPWILEFDSGMQIGQLVFTNLFTPASSGYGSAVWGSHYQNQSGATSAKTWGV